MVPSTSLSAAMRAAVGLVTLNYIVSGNTMIVKRAQNYHTVTPSIRLIMRTIYLGIHPSWLPVHDAKTVQVAQICTF